MVGLFTVPAWRPRRQNNVMMSCACLSPYEAFCLLSVHISQLALCCKTLFCEAAIAKYDGIMKNVSSASARPQFFPEPML